ncbi:MAG: hypothetical protein EP330_14240 [Deltaproteobacteria bacterium]|nr:MAG: hypothetical protein EP330_14240 [Deltaproteobacteria bacterium]
MRSLLVSVLLVPALALGHPCDPIDALVVVDAPAEAVQAAVDAHESPLTAQRCAETAELRLARQAALLDTPAPVPPATSLPAQRPLPRTGGKPWNAERVVGSSSVALGSAGLVGALLLSVLEGWGLRDDHALSTGTAVVSAGLIGTGVGLHLDAAARERRAAIALSGRF